MGGTSERQASAYLICVVHVRLREVTGTEHERRLITVKIAWLAATRYEAKLFSWAGRITRSLYCLGGALV